MESLNLKKFKDAKLTETQLMNCQGGASSRQESCEYSTERNIWDTQTDFYSDDCDDGQYNFVGNCVKMSHTFGPTEVHMVC